MILQQYRIPPFSLEENPSRTLFLHFKQYKTPAVPQLCLVLAFSIIQTAAVSYFSISNRIEPQQHLVSKFLMKGKLTSPHFCFLNNMKPQPHLSRTFFQHFQQYKTPAVTYFSILNRVEYQEHLISGFLMEKNPSSTLFQHFEQKKCPVVPYFCIFNNIRPNRTLFQHFKQIKCSAVPYFGVFIRIEPQRYLISAF